MHTYFHFVIWRNLRHPRCNRHSEFRGLLKNILMCMHAFVRRLTRNGSRCTQTANVLPHQQTTHAVYGVHTITLSAHARIYSECWLTRNLCEPERHTQILQPRSSFHVYVAADVCHFVARIWWLNAPTKPPPHSHVVYRLQLLWPTFTWFCRTLVFVCMVWSHIALTRSL